MIDNSIAKLVQYGINTDLINEEDLIYDVNRILEILNKDSYEPDKAQEKEINLEEVLTELLDYAAKQNLLEHNTIGYRDLFDTKLMGCLTPRPSEVNQKFWQLYKVRIQIISDVIESKKMCAGRRKVLMGKLICRLIFPSLKKTQRQSRPQNRRNSQVIQSAFCVMKMLAMQGESIILQDRTTELFL